MSNTNFKKGDKVIKARMYSSSRYCRYSGDDTEVPLGTEGEVLSGGSDMVNVRFKTGHHWNVDSSEIDLVIKSKDTFEVGDKVKATKSYDGEKPKGIGIIKHVSKGTSMVAVEFLDFNKGHDGLSNSCLSPHGWNYNSDDIKDYLKHVSKSLAIKEASFKIGDIVTGNGLGTYMTTTTNALMEVVKKEKDDEKDRIRVKILIHKLKSKQNKVGHTFQVNPKNFKLVEKVKRKKIESERKKIVAEINKNPSMKKCFENVEKEVAKFNIIQVLTWSDKSGKLIKNLF